MNNKYIYMYIDGSCIKNPGKGGYCVILLNDKKKKVISSGYEYTTNNRMELMSAVKALNIINNIKEKKNVIIFTDSKYLFLGVTKWVKKWKMNIWNKKKNKKVKNIDLWKRIYYLLLNNKKKIF